jgi:hypothetical protein
MRLIRILACGFATLWLASQVAHAQNSAALTVDFGSPIAGNKSMLGLLHAADSINPPDSVIAPLRPDLWRVGNYALEFFQKGAAWPQIYGRIAGFGARVELVVSDTWAGGIPAKTGGWPYDNWANWDSHVVQLADQNKGRNIMWDVWNEPNVPASWAGTQEQLFETYLHTYNDLRQELGPDALVGGPSLSPGTSFSDTKAYIQALLDYCKANGCQVNFVSWHALQDTNQQIPALAANVADIRNSFFNNPSYASLGLKEIHVNEVIGPGAKHDPGGILAYYYYLEQGGADGAAKACWADSQGASECDNDTLDGLLTAGTFQPRAGWWAAKAYADGFASRVASDTSNPLVIVLGSSGGPGSQAAQVLVGYFNYPSAKAPAVSPTVTLKNLPKLGFLADVSQVHLKFEKIPATAEAALAAPIVTLETDVPIGSGTAQVTIPGVNAAEAYRITLTRPGIRSRMGRRP